jgi:KilA domain-containing protein
MKSKSPPARKVNLDVKGTTIAVVSQKGDDYICITDIARYKDNERTDYIIQNWLRNRNTIEFLGIWEQLNNPEFNPIEFDGIIEISLNE